MVRRTGGHTGRTTWLTRAHSNQRSDAPANTALSSFGSNAGFVDELYARYLQDPQTVSEAWRDFFADYPPGEPGLAGAAEPAVAAAPQEGAGAAHLAAAADDALLVGAAPVRPGVASEAPASPAAARAAAEPAVAAPAAQPEGAKAMVGAVGQLAAHMTASLAVPTATSVRTMAVKLLEENRRVLNQHQGHTAGTKISFTHLIAWAMVRALDQHRHLNDAYLEQGGVAYRVARPHINLGLAVDVERKGERMLLVPNLKDVASFDFPTFVTRYNDLITRARLNKLRVEELQETTATLTNPGMLGTSLSVPRLMRGQSLILGVGAVGYPAEFAGMTAEAVSQLGLSKTMTLTSTYDHRVVQGVESGAFLATIEDLIGGKQDFYERIFLEIGVPHEPLKWSGATRGELAGGGVTAAAVTAPGRHEAIEKQAQVLQLIRAFRVRGHLWAHIDPLGKPTPADKELELSHYGLTVWDLDREFFAGDLAGKKGTRTLREILEILRDTYCRRIGVEFMHVNNPVVRTWLYERMESTRNSEPLSVETQLRILTKLNAAEALERFLHTTYLGHKRFSLEGGESLIPMLDALLNDAADLDIQEVGIGMAHRGRLTVLANTVGKSYAAIFSEFEGNTAPESAHGSGDVKYHMGASGVHTTPQGKAVRVEVVCNPSHLEAVDPVLEGMVRARQELLGDKEHARVLAVLIHGDAAFAGQGVVAETLNLSELPGYRTGGTVHIVVNNQIGFTTHPSQARSSIYATDVAKMVRAPILHVNGDHPDDAVRVVKLALAFRQRFKRDIVVDLNCYRRWGHNETDDPSYTSPTLYARIEKHRSVRKIFTEALLRRGDIDVETAEKALDDFRARLQQVHDEVRRVKQEATPESFNANAEALEGETRASATAHEAQFQVQAPSAATLEQALQGLEQVPPGFTVHPKLAAQLSRRRERFSTGNIDWALAESLAFGALVLEGKAVRLSGEDSGRGTFSQRHVILYDYQTAQPYVQLAHLSPQQAPFMVFDSQLSEFAVLGFEYGYSVHRPEALTLWEAQFGDFANGAQVIIDQFISSAEDKWRQKSGLVLLLPHGYEGQGPEHSSARLERYLQLCARGNMRVCYPSTPASYFHLLRRQALTPVLKPLVVLTPKSLLRLPECVSTATQLLQGGFAEVLDDATVAPGAPVRRVLLCSGKVYYDLEAYRREHRTVDVAIVRLEQFYPFPGEMILQCLARYAAAQEVVWVQEEPKNMGAWFFVQERLQTRLGGGRRLTYVGRPPSPSPATGSGKRHAAQQALLVQEAFAR